MSLKPFCSYSSPFSEFELVRDGRMDVWTDGWMEQQTDQRTDGRTNGQIHPLIEMRERI